MTQQSWFNWETRDKVWRRNHRTLWKVDCFITDDDLDVTPRVDLYARIEKALLLQGVQLIDITSIDEECIYMVTREITP